MIKKILLLFFLIFHLLKIEAQINNGYSKNYQPIKSGNILCDKNFYLLTALARYPKINQLIAENKTLNNILKSKIDSIHLYAYKNGMFLNADSTVGNFIWSKEDTATILQVLGNLYQSNTSLFDKLINNDLRPSGNYQKFINRTNADLFQQAWRQYLYGTNYIISQYGLGKHLRYPSIDSISYDVNGEYFRYMLKPLFNFLDSHQQEMTLFYQPTLQLAIRLMEANDRDEAARFEPMGNGENKEAVKSVKSVDWSKYQYSVIMVPGEGPELYSVPLSFGGKLRCELAAERYNKGLAPYIIVSGGYCHPFHTPYCEAIEMKKYLITKFNIPEKAIIIEPHARHTTTNFRNANRLIIRYNIPINKPALCVSTSDQSGYIADDRFDTRNLKELGYLPYQKKQKISSQETVFYPTMESLQMDPLDPLDP
ncbi:YdcF family protein [Chitinophaga sp. LS1]|uniref:YdcF family protein n=1 Tax=Chitinophaga sp. LS1 TaxID=3051176 RepID=UPI002AAADE44|nr:YdcF family protein [Chitinophaga sp. LS1]WPV67801.1 YdcF family protein [Chitinophaga sp. LS1]